MLPTLRLQLLGGFSVEYDHEPITRLGSLRLQSLLAYLLLHRDTPSSRRHLAFLLWPDSSETQARVNLRKLFHLLRLALPDADRYLYADPATIQWRPQAPVSVDVVEFGEALAHAHRAEQAGDRPANIQALMDAAARYRGDLLPGCYDEWINPERERMRQQYGDALRRLVELREAERDYAGAITWAQRLAQHDPVDESSHRQLLRLYALCGDRASAIRTYHTFASVMERELGVDPGPDIQEAYERLLASPGDVKGDARSVARLDENVRLVGRTREWAGLRSAWESTAPGKPGLVLLLGESGAGKTRLAEELVEWVGRQGVPAAAARSFAGEDSLAFTPVTAWLRSSALSLPLRSLSPLWLTEVARLLPELLVECPGLAAPQPLTEKWQRQRFFEALLRAFQPPGRALLLVLDDLQWCDRETLDWLRFMLRSGAPLRLLFVAAAREEELEPTSPAGEFVETLRAARLLTEISIGPLSEAETAVLAADIAGHEFNPGDLARLYRQSEGNALFIIETVRAGSLAGQAQARPEDNAWVAIPGAPLPERVQAAISTRLEQLSPPARDIAGAAATLGRSFSVALLVRLVGDEDQVVRGLDELWRRRIVREQGTDDYDFIHDNVRWVAYSSQSAARRRLLHRRAAEALEALYAWSGTDARHPLHQVSAQIAAHYERAGLPASAIPSYRRAAEAARLIYADEPAREYLRRALALFESDPSLDEDPRVGGALAADLETQLGDLLAKGGMHEAARSAYESAQRRAGGDVYTRVGLDIKIGNLWTVQRGLERALASYARAESSLESDGAERGPRWWQAWIQIQLERMWAYYWMSDWRTTTELANRAEPILQQHGTRSQRLNYRVNLATMILLRERWAGSEQAVAQSRAALSISQEGKDPGEIAWAQFILGLSLLWNGDLKEAQANMQEALAIAERTGDLVHQSRCLTYLAIAYRKEKQPELAREAASRALAAASSCGMVEYQATARANQAWLLWRERKNSQAEALCQMALRLWQELPPGHPSALIKWTALLPLMSISLARGRTEQAVDCARRLLAPDQQRLPAILTDTLEGAIEAWQLKRGELAARNLEAALRTARDLGLL